MNIDIIKKRMEDLKVKWIGKPEPKEYSKEWWQRKADRIIYRDLLNKLKSLELPLETEKSAYDLALDVFGIKDTT